jgi:hypothetical protein
MKVRVRPCFRRDSPALVRHQSRCRHLDRPTHRHLDLKRLRMAIARHYGPAQQIAGSARKRFIEARVGAGPFRCQVSPSWGCGCASAIARRWNAECRYSRSIARNVVAKSRIPACRAAPRSFSPSKRRTMTTSDIALHHAGCGDSGRIALRDVVNCLHSGT